MNGQREFDLADGLWSPGFRGRTRTLQRNTAFLRQRGRVIDALPDKSDIPSGTMQLCLLERPSAPVSGEFAHLSFQHRFACVKWMDCAGHVI